jgi:SnoaL-like domain
MSNIDPKKLDAVASASAEAYDKAIRHIEQEIAARDPEKLGPLVATLADEGPYAYTILPEVSADGAVRLPVLTTKEQITEAYGYIRGLSDLHAVIGLTEVRGSWYLFQNNMTRGSLKGGDVMNTRETLSIFPSGSGPGITGELVWLRVPRERLGAPDEADVTLDDPLLARFQVYEQFGRYLEGWRANDVDAVLEGIHDGAASAVRDYVDDTGTLVELTGKDAHRAWFEALFAKFEVQSVQPLYQVTEDWYVFAELRVTASRRDGGGTVAFHTAEFHVTSRDGRFIARVGHGTDPV